MIDGIFQMLSKIIYIPLWYLNPDQANRYLF